MKLNQAFISELKSEGASTRKMLERVPEGNLGWKPHEKSMTIGRLATHIAELPSWVAVTLNTDELDFSKREYKPHTAANREELLAIHDKNIADAIASLEKSTDEELMKNWTLRNGETVYFTLPKIAAMRGFAFNHLYHHRGQLSVFLRLNDIHVPGMYGPSADDRIIAETTAAQAN